MYIHSRIDEKANKRRGHTRDRRRSIDEQVRRTGIRERRAKRFFASTGRMENRARRNTRGNHEPAAYRWAATLPEPCSREHYQLLLPLRSQPHFARPPRALSAYSRVTTHLFPGRHTKTRACTMHPFNACFNHTTRQDFVCFSSLFSKPRRRRRNIASSNIGNYDGEERPRNSSR